MINPFRIIKTLQTDVHHLKIMYEQLHYDINKLLSHYSELMKLNRRLETIILQHDEDIGKIEVDIEDIKSLLESYDNNHSIH